jgi:hypothetical protein
MREPWFDRIAWRSSAAPSVTRRYRRNAGGSHTSSFWVDIMSARCLPPGWWALCCCVSVAAAGEAVVLAALAPVSRIGARGGEGS